MSQPPNKPNRSARRAESSDMRKAGKLDTAAFLKLAGKFSGSLDYASLAGLTVSLAHDGGFLRKRTTQIAHHGAGGKPKENPRAEEQGSPKADLRRWQSGLFYPDLAPKTSFAPVRDAILRLLARMPRSERD